MPSDYNYAETSFGGVFHKHFGTGTRQEAKAFCDNDGTSLPIPRNLDENRWYGENLHGDSKWLGVSETDPGVWKADDDTDIEWTFWRPNHPTDRANETFVSMGLNWWEWNNVASPDGQWSKAHIHCVFRLKPFNPIPQPEEYGVPSDYTYAKTSFGSIFYKHYGRKERNRSLKNY